MKFDSYEYAIGGKMVVGKAVMSDSYQEMLASGNLEAIRQVKSELIHQMAEFILENKLVEFTQWRDPSSYETHVAVRAYLAPSDQVKILRLAKNIL